MRKGAISLSTGLLCCTLSFSSQVFAATEKAKTPKQAGKELAITYCQACHFFEGTDQAGTVAPPLAGMKTRFPERQQLRDIINDPHAAIKAHTMMPPFGRNGLLTKAQIEQIIDFLYEL